MGLGGKILNRYLGESAQSRVVDRYLEASDRQAIEFPNEGAMQQYLQKHPGAKRNNHWVKGQKPQDAPEKKPRKPRGPNKPKPPAAKDPRQEVPEHSIGPRKQQLSIPYSKLKNTEPAYAERNPERPQLSFPYTKLKNQPGKKEQKPEEKPKQEAPKPKHPFQGKLTVKSRKQIGAGVMGAEFVTVKDEAGKEHKGVWKSVKGEFLAQEEHGQIRDNIETGTAYEREALASNLDGIFGGKQVVPPTYTQNLEDPDTGENVGGSLQEYVPGTVSSADMRDNLGITYRTPQEEIQKIYENLAGSFEAKKQFFLDAISANDDRHSGNTLWKKDKDHKFVPVAIDNGLTFPDGANCCFQIAVNNKYYQAVVCKPNDEIRKCLKNLDMQKLADELNNVQSLTGHAKVLTLARAQALKNNPDLLDQMILRGPDKDKGKPGDNVYDYYAKPESMMFSWVNMWPQERLKRGEITQAQYDEIRKLAKDD